MINVQPARMNEKGGLQHRRAATTGDRGLGKWRLQRRSWEFRENGAAFPARWRPTAALKRNVPSVVRIQKKLVSGMSSQLIPTQAVRGEETSAAGPPLLGAPGQLGGKRPRLRGGHRSVLEQQVRRDGDQAAEEPDISSLLPTSETGNVSVCLNWRLTGAERYNSFKL